MTAASLKQILGNKRIGMMLPLGFASGLPLALTAGTLQAWLAVVGVDLKTIGIFTLVGLPYTLKFLWAPLMDRIVPPWLGRRRGWMLIMQITVALGLALMGLVGPGELRCIDTGRPHRLEGYPLASCSIDGDRSPHGPT